MRTETMAVAEQIVIDSWRATDGAIEWPRFLQTLQQWCNDFGWNLEYERVEDESCAIFFMKSLPKDECLL